LNAIAHSLPLLLQEEARALVSFAKFPVPKSRREPGVISGIRGVGSPFAPAVFGQTSREYTATANHNTFIAVQIESVEGLDNCEAIAKVEGVGETLTSLLFSRVRELR
jgi:4-hydroxy-2-oxoheptanedioate aldolase